MTTSARSCADIQKFCAHCHAAEVIDLRKSVHAKAGAKNAQGEGTLLELHGVPRPA